MAKLDEFNKSKIDLMFFNEYNSKNVIITAPSQDDGYDNQCSELW